ncbi:MAG: F0F1 ATP synthase subunit B, partial [Rhizobiales bacterium]|nr:F0F1 ATP synthase subunit B [Hyphomicrobiales bacterium]
MSFFHQAETWVLVAFILFIALLVYLKVPGKVAAMLDDRASKIASELAEAKRLREEAQALLAEYQKKRVDAERDAVNIIEQAKREAEAFAQEARAKLSETLDRRSRQAEQ